MASGADFPVRTICPLPWLSVCQGIAAVPRPFMMNGKHAAIELTRALDTANQALGFDKGENADIAGPAPGNRCHPVKRIAPLKNLQVTRCQRQGAHLVGAVVEHRPDCLERFIFGCPQIRRIFEHPAFLAVLDGQRDGEIVGIEMPWEPVPLFHHVDDHIGKRVGIAVEMLGLERGTDELLEWRKFIDGTKPVFGAEMIRRHKGVRTVIEAPPRVILR